MPNRHAHRAVLPTKTSLWYNQFAGVPHSFLSAGTHVSSTSFVNLFVLVIFIAVTLLMVSLLLIAHFHVTSFLGFLCVWLPALRSTALLQSCQFP